MEDMLIERTSNEVIIRLPASVDIIGLQRLIDYLTYKEATSNSKATQEQVNKLSKELNNYGLQIHRLSTRLRY
ncbi:MAG: hypothetical protein M9959_02745 [Chitinophagaceae bacterium]|nr:hypothetical protein [Chitinophagaceae bacterium]